MKLVKIEFQKKMGRNTYTRGCGNLLFPKKTTKGICKKEWDKDKYFKPSISNKCLSNCNIDSEDTTDYFIGYNNECLTCCPIYYIEISGKNMYNIVRTFGNIIF